MKKCSAILGLLMFVSLFSCSLPVIRSGSATAEFSLSGVISPTVFVKGQGTKAVSPATAVVEVEVSGSEGILRTVSVSMQSGENQIRVPNLPSGSALRFEIRTRNARGDIITKAAMEGILLAPGPNRLSAVLKPEASVVQSFTVPGAMGPEAPYVPVSNVPLDYNETKFFSVAFPGTYTGERHIFFDTGSTDWVWLSVYDENWLPLSTVTAAPEDGWVVVAIPATGGIVNIMIANALLSPGYTAAGVTGSLVLQKAVFFAAGASGTGTSANPAAFAAASFDANYKDKSLFLAAGDYDVSGTATVQMSSTSNYYLYGGFSADWKTRGNTTMIFSTSSMQTTIFDIGPNSGYYPAVLIDGISAEKRQLNSMGTAYALLASNGSNLRLYRSALNGNSNQSAVASGYPAKAAAVLFQGTRLEVGLSKLIGGYASTSSMVNADSYGLEITGANSPTVIVHTSVIAGGYAYTPGTSSTATTRGLSCVAPSAKLAVLQSRLIGGWAEGGTSASATGAYVDSAASPYGMVMASCQISGGLAQAGSSTTIVTGLRGLGASSFVYLLGNVLDTGNPAATTGARSARSIRLEGTPAATKSHASGNLLISTANGDAGQAALDANTAGFSENNSSFTGNKISAALANVFVSGTGFAVVPRYAGSPVDNVSNGAYSVVDSGTHAYDTAFTHFLPFPTTGTFDARLKAWLDGNVWKLASTASSLAANTTAVIPFTSILTDFPEAIPLLKLDFAGFARPDSGVWRVGAYE